MSTVKINSARRMRWRLLPKSHKCVNWMPVPYEQRWRVLFRKEAPFHLPRHLLRRVLAYRLQADRLGDLDPESQRLLDTSTSPEQVCARVTEARQRQIRLRLGTVLAREWKGQMQRVSVMADGFAWNAVPIPVCPGSLVSSRARAGMVLNSSGCA